MEGVNMNVITVAVLFVVSNGSYNYGTVTFKEFADPASCKAVADAVKEKGRGDVLVGCVAAKVYK